MKHSEFEKALEVTFGTSGASHAQDLYLLCDGGAGGGSARELLEQGVAPGVVWRLLCEALDRPDALWVHRSTGWSARR